MSIEQVALSNANYSIPAWQQIVSFYLSITITCFSLFFLVKNFLAQAKLKIFVTKYFFVRVAPFGEALYAHTISMSLNESALIKNVYAKLNKKTGANKKYSLETHMVCEVNSLGLGNDYKILSFSPLTILEKEKAHANVYVFVISEYKDKIQKTISTLENFMLLKKIKFDEAKENEELRNEILGEVIQAQFLAARDVYESLQIEDGTYDLAVYVEYERKIPGINYRYTCTAKSILEFKIDISYKEIMRNKIKDSIRQAGFQIMFGTQGQIKAPQYDPYDIKENI